MGKVPDFRPKGLGFESEELHALSGLKMQRQKGRGSLRVKGRG